MIYCRQHTECSECLLQLTADNPQSITASSWPGLYRMGGNQVPIEIVISAEWDTAIIPRPIFRGQGRVQQQISITQSPDTGHRGLRGKGRKRWDIGNFFIFYISVLLQTAFGLDVVMMPCIRSCNNVIQQDFSLFVSIELPHGQIASSGRTKLFLAEAMML